MSNRSMDQVSSCKLPVQTRSEQTVADILEAAAQVLRDHGANRFTTARVAERAGVSIGSLYQYFPNKASILFRLQTEEWARTGSVLEAMLGDTSAPPLERLTLMVRVFFRSECEEAAMRTALDDAAPIYRDAPETQKVRTAGTRTLLTFIDDILPNAPHHQRVIAADMISTTMGAVGKSVSEGGYGPAEVDARADALSAMFCAYFVGLEARLDPSSSSLSSS